VWQRKTGAGSGSGFLTCADNTTGISHKEAQKVRSDERLISSDIS
jgi:hypothetical protein